jgi:hypothetical protein
MLYGSLRAQLEHATSAKIETQTKLEEMTKEALM